MEVAEAMAPAGQLAEDEGCPPLREDLGSLSDRTELAISLHPEKFASSIVEGKSTIGTGLVHDRD
jgi:hypothetical protein